MRPIKFRGRSLDTGEWIYGESILIDHEITDRASIMPDDTTDGLFEEVEYSTVGQFSGLYDSDGREIYEGDVLECPNVPTLPLEVYHNPAKGSFCLAEHTHIEGVINGTTPIGEMLMYYPNMHIIGSIHDRSELLKTGKEG